MSKPATRVTTPEGTLSFPHLLQPKSSDDGDPPKHSCTLIFDKGQDLSNVEAAIEAAVQRGVEKKWGGTRPAKLVLPIKDGNEKTDAEGKQRPEFADRMYITASCSAEEKPRVVDASTQPITDPSEVYGGARARLAVSAFPWTFKGKKGVSLYLKNVQITGEGTPFGVVVTVEEDFS